MSYEIVFMHSSCVVIILLNTDLYFLHFVLSLLKISLSSLCILDVFLSAQFWIRCYICRLVIYYLCNYCLHRYQMICDFVLTKEFLKAHSQFWDSTESPLEMMKNAFYFNLKSSFRSQDLWIFVLTFWSCRKMAWLEK